MSIKDGLNWLKKQAASPADLQWDPRLQPAVNSWLADNGEASAKNVLLGTNDMAPVIPGIGSDIDAERASADAFINKPNGAASSADQGAASQVQGLMAGPAQQPQPATSQFEETDIGPTPSAEEQRLIDLRNNGPEPEDELQAPTPSVPTTAATMADGPAMPSANIPAFPEWQDKPAPPPSVPTTAATMADGPGEIQSDFLNGNSNTQPQQPSQPQQPQQAPAATAQSNPVVDPAVANTGIISQTAGNSTAQTQAMPNGSADYSRIFGRGFKADSGSASDKWLAGQADKLRTAGYSDNQISTMLDQNAWRKYGRRGQDYQVNTKRYTKPLGMKSASASDALWARQAGLDDDIDDLYVRRLRVGLWDKYNG